MSARVMTTRCRVVMASLLGQGPFVAALSSGDPAWDARWGTSNPPVPTLDVSEVLNLLGFVRPTIVDFVEPNVDGAIATDEDGSYSVAAGMTRYLRIRVSVPPGSHFAGQNVRELAIFRSPTFRAGVPAGRTVLLPEDVVAAGDPCFFDWFDRQPLSAGTGYARNIILRV